MAESPGPTWGPEITVVCIVMMVLSVIAVTFRVWSRFVSKQGFWWDDWTAIASLPTLIGLLSMTFVSVSAGLGCHIDQLTREDLIHLYKYRYAVCYLYEFGITLPKLSAVLFYTRVFRVTWNTSVFFRANILVAAGLVMAWLLFAIPSTIFQCNNEPESWLSQRLGHCINFYQWFLGSTIASVIIDLYITLVPVPVLWGLHVGRPRRMVLIGFFFCAYCVVACSLGRLISLVQDKDKLDADSTWNAVTYSLWSIAEVAISVICICLPNILYLIQRARQHGIGAVFTRREYKSWSPSHTVPGARKRESQRVTGHDTMTPLAMCSHGEENISTQSQGGLCSVNASAEQRQRSEDEEVVLGQVPLSA